MMRTRPRILIADDEEDIRQGFRRLLEKIGCDVVGEAVDGVHLVELCGRTHPDLVITDIRMPQLSGIEAAKKIRESQSTPVIVVSSHERPSVEDCPSISAFLLKPVSVPELQAVITRVIGGN
ncbi:response regulator [Rhodopirellula sallentina]|uniref:Response regulator receiver and ANTAR domain-containing protein n=1 Tax=Rhodopirellula sallentina SM41 TaxID=1263870 RepID=M5U1A1_9BACT|nr:response regulator [Rhodopirellula sallentina]EMI55064.1 response regulator receiver and ANTAR domain-containing protein [Rhodopirellula sallentina SM41]